MNLEHLAEILVVFFLGGAAGAAVFWIFQRLNFGKFEKIAKDIIQKAEFSANEIKKSGEFTLKQQQLEQQREMEQLWQSERRKIQREEDWLKQREDKLEARMNVVEKKLTDIESRESALCKRKNELDEEKKLLDATHSRLLCELEKISGLSVAEAKDILIDRMTNDVKSEAANLIRRIKKEAEEEADREASSIIATAINRLAVSCVSEATINTVSIPNDELKGRIIGKEGRNIRALEHATGVNFIIDDTPGAVVLSGFDPIRMAVAKMTIS